MTPVPPKVRAEVEERSGGRCEMPTLAVRCPMRATHMHHRKMRSQGGDHSAANLLHLCGFHHDYIHAHPAESYANGWLVRSWDEAS